METILLNICLILFAIYFYKKIRHGLHILQLENYYNDRYAVWLKKNINIVLNVKAIGMLIIPIVLILINQVPQNPGCRIFAVWMGSTIRSLSTRRRPSSATASTFGIRSIFSGFTGRR